MVFVNATFNRTLVLREKKSLHLVFGVSSFSWMVVENSLYASSKLMSHMGTLCCRQISLAICQELGLIRRLQSMVWSIVHLKAKLLCHKYCSCLVYYTPSLKIGILFRIVISSTPLMINHICAGFAIHEQVLIDRDGDDRRTQ